MAPGRRWLCVLALVACAVASRAHGASSVDLAGPFRARSPWRLVATQGSPTTDYGGNPAPGEIYLCLERGPGGPCLAGPVSTAAAKDVGPAPDWAPHYLRLARPVFPRGGSPPLLQIVTASLSAGDGGQVVVTQLLKYDPGGDAFERVYLHSTGTNNNQEDRFVLEGPLRGDVVSAESTRTAPFAYWISVSRFDRRGGYRQGLRYRSATRYGDGNTLAVIDSEMPNLQRRLGLWRPGAPLPTPAGGAKPCPHPKLKRMELWCE